MYIGLESNIFQSHKNSITENVVVHRAKCDCEGDDRRDQVKEIPRHLSAPVLPFAHLSTTYTATHNCRIGFG